MVPGDTRFRLNDSGVCLHAHSTEEPSRGLKDVAGFHPQTESSHQRHGVDLRLTAAPHAAAGSCQGTPPQGDHGHESVHRPLHSIQDVR